MKSINPHQSAVAACLLDGMCDKEIARAMGVSLKSVSNHMRNLRGVIGARNTRDLIVKLCWLEREHASAEVGARRAVTKKLLT